MFVFHCEIQIQTCLFVSESFALMTDNDGVVCVFCCVCVCVSGGLDAQVGERGKSFSVGQRQLLCLARALLTRAKVRASEQRPAISVGRIIQLVFPVNCVFGRPPTLGLHKRSTNTVEVLVIVL